MFPNYTCTLSSLLYYIRIGEWFLFLNYFLIFVEYFPPSCFHSYCLSFYCCHKYPCWEYFVLGMASSLCRNRWRISPNFAVKARKEKARDSTLETETLCSSLLLFSLVLQDNHKSLSLFLKPWMFDKGSYWNWEDLFTGKI